MLVLSLCVIVPLAITGYGYVADKTAEFVYQYAAPSKAIEHYFAVSIPDDTVFLEYEYRYDSKGTSGIKAKISFSIDGRNAFFQSMDLGS